MFTRAGYSEVQETQAWSDGMIDAVTFSGAEDAVAERVGQLFDWGASEVLASIVAVDPDREASWRRTVSLLAQLNKSI